MSRGFGEIEVIQSAIPDWLGVLVALVTQLGDGWFLFVLFGLLFVKQTKTRSDILLVVGVLAAGTGLYNTLKHLFGLSRPESPLLNPEELPELVAPVYEVAAHASGFGFPSGHATVATIAYFGLATVLDVGSRRQRFTGAGLIVVLVAFSRVALGVHFLVDVLAGVVLGATLLVITFHILDRLSLPRETTVLTAAVVLSVFWVITSNAHVESVLLLVGSLALLGGLYVVPARIQSKG